MPRAWMVVSALAIACGPIVATSDDGETGIADVDGGDDDRGDDRPGTGPQPTTVPPPDDDGPIDEGDEFVDEGWTPDFGDGIACSDSALDACYDASELGEYDGEVLAIAIGDVTNDAQPDVVVLGELWQVVHPGQSGSWSDPIATASPFASTGAAVIGDVGGNGLPDLVVLQWGIPAIHVAEGTGDGGFLLPTQVDTPAQPMHVLIADVDGMLPSEIVIALADGSLAVIHWLEPPVLEVFDAPVFDVRALAVGDIGFGTPYLLAAGTSIDQHLIGTSSYENAAADQWAIDVFVEEPHGLALGDFDADGEVDVATAAGASAYMFPHVANGSFTDPIVVPLASTPIAAAGGRFGPSLAGLATIVDGTVQVADFAANDAQIVNGPTVRPPLVAADLNADGVDDLVAASSDGERVVVYQSGE